VKKRRHTAEEIVTKLRQAQMEIGKWGTDQSNSVNQGFL